MVDPGARKREPSKPELVAPIDSEPPRPIQGVDALACANAIIRGVLDRLAEHNDLATLLAEAVSVCARELDAAGAGIWLRVEDGVHCLVASFDQGRVRACLEPPYLDRREFDESGLAIVRGEVTVRAGAELRALPWSRLIRDPPSGPKPVAVASAAMFVGQRWVGTIVLRHLHDRFDYSGERRGLVLALANQVALALELTRLAEEAKEAALAREREEAERRRADALARANSAMRSSLGRLTQEQDMDAFLSQTLTVACQQFGAMGGAIWLGRGNEERLLLSLHEGQVLTPGQIRPGGHEELQHGPAFALAQSRGAEIRRGVTTTFSISDLENHRDLEGFRDHLTAMGVGAVVVVPMFLGDALLGTMTLRFKQEGRLTPDDEQLAQVFANQTALALQLKWLGDDARMAAVVKERESAARQKSEAAERTAATFRLSLDLLAKEPELERFLGHVLLAANAQLNIRHSTLWIFDSKRFCNVLHMRCDDGSLATDPKDESGEPIVSWLADFKPWRQFVEGRAPMTFDHAVENPELAPEARAALANAGVRTIMLVPLMFGSEMLGSFGLDNTERDIWTDDEINLAKALGDEATLALQLTRLAEQAREGAVFGERNRMAREIHDTLAQGFAAIRLQLDVARSYSGLPPEADRALELAHLIASENLVEARRSMAVLKQRRPGLTASLLAAVEGVRRLGAVQILSRIRTAPEPPGDIGHELVRIAQEAMLNAVRHADPQTIEVCLTAAQGRGLQISVVDDGKGFDPLRVNRGFGLAGMRERAAAIGAKLDVSSRPGGGATVTVTWSPIPHRADTDQTARRQSSLPRVPTPRATRSPRQCP